MRLKQDYKMTSYHPLPQPHELSKAELEDAMGAYLMMFAALGAGLPLPMINLLASIVYYFINRKKSRFVRFHVIQSMWSQLPVTLLNGFLVVWTIRIFIAGDSLPQIWFGLLITALIANVIYLVFSLYAAVLARKGRMYYFIFFGNLAYHRAFRYEDGEAETIVENRPPV